MVWSYICKRNMRLQFCGYFKMYKCILSCITNKWKSIWFIAKINKLINKRILKLWKKNKLLFLLYISSFICTAGFCRFFCGPDKGLLVFPLWIVFFSAWKATCTSQLTLQILEAWYYIFFFSRNHSVAFSLSLTLSLVLPMELGVCF